MQGQCGACMRATLSRESPRDPGILSRRVFPTREHSPGRVLEGYAGYGEHLGHGGYVRPIPVLILWISGFDSSTILILWGGILMSIGDFPESLSQAISVGVMLLVGALVGSSQRGFSKGGFSNNDMVIAHKLLKPPLLNPPL